MSVTPLCDIRDRSGETQRLGTRANTGRVGRMGVDEEGHVGGVVGRGQGVGDGWMSRRVSDQGSRRVVVRIEEGSCVKFKEYRLM